MKNNGMGKNGWFAGSLIWPRFLAVFVILLLMCSVFVVLPAWSEEKGVKAAPQTISTYFKDNTTFGGRAGYVNGTGAQNWIAYWTNWIAPSSSVLINLFAHQSQCETDELGTNCSSSIYNKF